MKNTHLSEYDFETGNAHGGQAGSADTALTGHCFAGMRYDLECDPPITVHSIIEGTKWVEPMMANVTTRASRNAGLDAPALQAVNQLSQLSLEMTKLADVDPIRDRGGSLLQIQASTILFCCGARITQV